jgi:hypothetical protein
MAGGTGQDVFKTPVKDVLSAEDVRSAEMAKTMLACVQKGPAGLPESLLSAVFGSRKAPKFFFSAWTPPGSDTPSEELMREFVNATHAKNRLVGQQKRRTTLRKLLETDRKNVLLDASIGRNMKEAKVKAIDVKIQRNVKIAANKHRQIARYALRLGNLVGRLRAL